MPMGRVIVKVVPSRRLSTSRRRRPRWSGREAEAGALLALVVKKGSNTFLRTSSDMPMPVSATVMTA
jgi:hypothetical protein